MKYVRQIIYIVTNLLIFYLKLYYTNLCLVKKTDFSKYIINI